jgi:dTDP-4-amino-4,6-dideoxygalactose transaminase
MAVRFLDLGRQYLSIKTEIDSAIADVIRDTAFISGEYVSRFEREFAAYSGAKHCVACGNGTDAIEIALEALNLPPQSEIIVPANTFIASAEAVTRLGHRVVFCDCDPVDYTISVDSMRSKLTSRTRAVIAVHLYGHPCDMPAILSAARQADLKVVEDCAQAHGAECYGRRVGTFGDVGAFSFYPGKNLGAYGDAGAIVTADESLARRMRMIANHGRVEKYDHEFEGRNSRMDGIQGAVLSAKLAHLDGWIAHRRSISACYAERLDGVGDMILPTVRQWAKHAFHLYVIRTRHRDSLRTFLASSGIETGIHYPRALPKLTAYHRCGQAGEPLFANRVDGELLSLPIGEHMTAVDVDEVAEACRQYFRSTDRQER